MTFFSGALRDEVYTRILTKRTANAFTFNDFLVEKSWKPYSTLEKLATDAGGAGKVYVLCNTPGDINAATRSSAGLRYYAVTVAYQRVVKEKIDDVAFMDTLGLFMQELEFMCRKEVGDVTGETNEYAFSHLEYLKDENGIPYTFTQMRRDLTFESYFTAFYNLVHS